MTFHWNWCSHTGVAREENQDHAGIALSDDFLFAVVADGVFSRPQSGNLARALVANLVDRAIGLDHQPGSAEVVAWVADAHLKMKTGRAPKSAVSFLATVFFRERLQFAVHAGDCRVGIQDSISGIAWKTPVHSLATALRPLPEDELRTHKARNQLTRTFNTKRFCVPEITEFDCAYDGGVVLVTDGYWAGLPLHIQQKYFASTWGADVTCDDDVSRLAIRWENTSPLRLGGQDNLYVKIKSK
jgi:serine/threonine protein phosphatase PrpC